MNKKKWFKYAFLYYIGFVTHITIEVLYRGYSHWSMGILGGLCFISLGLINKVLPWETPFWLQMLIGGSIITILELGTGLIVNIWLGWNVWDYNLPFNFMHQISLFSSIGWCLLSSVGIILDDYLRYWFFNEDKPHYKFI